MNCRLEREESPGKWVGVSSGWARRCCGGADPEDMDLSRWDQVRWILNRTAGHEKPHRIVSYDGQGGMRVLMEIVKRKEVAE